MENFFPGFNIIMIIGTLKIKIYAPWVHSLKEKRMVVKSMCTKVGNKFNVSVAEVEEQGTHQTIVLGISFVTTDKNHGDSIADKVLNFIESNTEGELVVMEREFF